MKNFVVETGPYILSNNKTTKIMRNVLIALLPIILFTIYKNGYIPYLYNKVSFIGIFYPLIFILIPTITTYLMESLYALIIQKNKRAFKDSLSASYAIFPGLFLGLVLSINTPIWLLIVAAVFASIIGKMIFGGFGRNVFNPALTGSLLILVIYLLGIVKNGGYLNGYELDTLSSATPLSNLATVTGLGTYASNVAPFGSLWNFFIGTIPGAVGETSAFLCLIGLIYLTITKSVKWKIPIIYIATVFIITFGIGSINKLGVWYPLFEILSGGLMFGAIFMATDPVTSPVTPIGQTIYALFLGILTVIIRYLSPFPEGVLISILMMNLLVPLIDQLGSKARFNFNYTIISYVGAWLAIIGLIIGIGLTNRIPENNNNSDPNFSIVSKNVTSSNTTYVVTQKGYSSTIKAKIIITNGKITTYEIVEQGESLYSSVEDADYTKTLIDHQSNLADADTVSGATITSTAMKKLLINTLEDYKKGDNTNINNDADTEETPKDPDFEVVNVTKSSTETIYQIKQKGFVGPITLNITFKNDVITNIEIISHDEHEYTDKVKNAGYLEKLITNQNSINTLDTVSGATHTSTALKEAMSNVINAYKEAKNQ